MTALSDLQDAAAALQTSATASSAEIVKAIALLQSLQNGTINPDDPQVEAVVTALTATKAQIDADTASLAAVAP